MPTSPPASLGELRDGWRRETSADGEKGMELALSIRTLVSSGALELGGTAAASAGSGCTACEADAIGAVVAGGGGADECCVEASGFRGCCVVFSAEMVL